MRVPAEARVFASDDAFLAATYRNSRPTKIFDKLDRAADWLVPWMSDSDAIADTGASSAAPW